MSDTYNKLVQMSNVQDMWDHFSKDFRYAIDVSVPTQTVRVRRDSQPPWFDRLAMKLLKTAKTVQELQGNQKSILLRNAQTTKERKQKNI